MNNFKEWKLFPNIPKRLHCEALHDDYEGFRLLLKSEDPSSDLLKIYFDAHLAYQNIDEGDRLRTISEDGDMGRSTLYTVENSGWVRWFCEECYGKYDSDEIVHYAIFTPNGCIDVLSKFPPEVSWI